jgi:hypothetical protein
MKKRDISIKTFSSSEEKTIRENFVKVFKKCPIPDNEVLSNLGLFLNSKNLSRVLFMDHLYRQILDVHGGIMEFGTRWGQNIALFSSFRGIYEPFNRNRKIVGFDTFEGFLEPSEKDGKSDMMKAGKYAVTENYTQYLTEIMDYHEKENPISHIKKYEIRKGNVVVEIERYLKENPETIIALAYFDLDLYLPTKKCLKAIRSHLTKGSVLAFDELNDHDCPGETIALKEVFGLEKIKLKRSPHTARISYFVVE